MNNDLNFPLLEAGDLEVRVATVKGDSNDKKGGVSLLVYKNARIDQNILDATVGRYNWQNRYYSINNTLHCIIEIWDDQKKAWVGRDNVGIESNAEAVKGEASDAFKRAAFNWGIGRELYTAPFIWVPSDKCTIYQTNGKWACSTRFAVKEISYDENRRICQLVIINDKTKQVVYEFNSGAKPTPSSPTGESIKNQPNALDLAFQTKVTIGIDKDNTLKEVYQLNNAKRLIWIADNDPVAGEAAKVVIDSNPKLSEYYKQYSGK